MTVGAMSLAAMETCVPSFAFRYNVLYREGGWGAGICTVLEGINPGTSVLGRDGHLRAVILFEVEGVGCGMWDVGCGMWGVGCGVWGVGFRVGAWGLEFCVARTPPPSKFLNDGKSPSCPQSDGRCALLQSHYGGPLEGYSRVVLGAVCQLVCQLVPIKNEA